MSGLETAIRNALSRSDRGDANVRARIYQSARQALEAGLQKQDISDAEVVDAQRRRLEDKIREIEIEERQRAAAVVPPTPAADAVQPAQPAAPHPEPSEPVSLGGQTRASNAAIAGGLGGGALGGALGSTIDAPSRDRPPQRSEADDSFGDLGAMRAEPASDRLAPPTAPVQPERQKRSLFGKGKVKPQPQPATAAVEAAPGVPGERRKRRRRGLISRLFIYLTFFTFLAMGGWWAYTSGLFLSAAERDTSVPNPPTQINEEDFQGAPATVLDPKQGLSSDWQEIYRPGGRNGPVPGANAAAETVDVADGSAVRLTSRAADASGDVAIPVPVEILREMAGKTSTIAITLQAVGDSSVQLAVRCDFASLGDCSRHRVTATQERSDTLFRVTFDRTLAPTQAGRIFVNSDILGGSQPILLYSVRVLPGQ